ncbi:hypothetical protein [uncultured Xanthomonas sp.]|uniref:hypothetical protein n=1 Tax=uncultured Xanthomonas sp. TaxID=152831 RepID=UPI0025EBA329|nr:hypothetical protein [uncultured Xanthomonas sp.]
MNVYSNQLEGVRWLHHDAAAYAGLDTVALELFRDKVSLTAIDALDFKIDQLETSENLADQVFAAEIYKELRQSTIEGFLLTTQSMHERALRGLILEMAKRKKYPENEYIKILKSVWSGDRKPTLQEYFTTLFEAPIQWFGDYDELDLLQILGSAIRHGDGASARKLHQICPSLWNSWLAPGTRLPTGQVVRGDAPSRPSFDSITLHRAILEQMFMAVFSFWEDIEFVRINSFSHQNSATEKSMKLLRTKREQRDSKRVWSPA